MTGFPKGIFFRKSIPRFIRHRKNMKPPVMNRQNMTHSICDKSEGSSVIFSSFFTEENYIIFDIDRKRMLDKLAIFDAKAALIDEKSPNRLNRELRDAQK